MKRTEFVAAIALLIPSLALAQGKRVEKNARVVDTNFVLVTSSLVTSMIFDVETTFVAIKNPNVREGNPIMRPFVNAGKPATYAFLGGVDAGIVYASYRMKKVLTPPSERYGG